MEEGTSHITLKLSRTSIYGMVGEELGQWDYYYYFYYPFPQSGSINIYIYG